MLVLCYLCLPRSALFGMQCVIVVFPDHTTHFLLLLLAKLYTRQTDWKTWFNAESHAIGIKPVHGIDDAIAKFVFDKSVEKMDIYISLIILT